MGWTQVKPLNHPRTMLAAAAYATEPTIPGPVRVGAHVGPSVLVYALGGYDGTSESAVGEVATVEAFDVSLGQWSPSPDMPNARCFLAATSGSDGLHALGGQYGNAILATHEIFRPIQHAGRRLSGWSPGKPMPTPRSGLAAVTGPDGLIYAIGGFDDVAGALGTIEAYDPGTQTWNNVPLKTMAPRFGLAAVVGPDGLIYAIGGQGNDALPLDIVEIFNPATGGWAPGPTLPVAVTGLAAAVGPNGLIYAIGGADAGYAAQTAVYCLDTTQSATAGWTPLPSPLPTAARFLAAAVGPNGLIYAIGGTSVTNAALGSAEAYSPLTLPGPGPILRI